MTSRIIPDTINPKRFPGIQQKFSKLSASRSGSRSEARSGARSGARSEARSEVKSGARSQNKGKSSARLLSSGKEERNKSVVNNNNNKDSSSKPRSPRLRKFGKCQCKISLLTLCKVWNMEKEYTGWSKKKFVDRSKGKVLNYKIFFESFSLYNIYSHLLKKLELSKLCTKRVMGL